MSDFSNAEQWDPGTQSCTRQDDGPVHVGSTWRNVSKVLGRQTELRYRLRTFEPDHLIFVGENKTATSTDDIRVRPAAGGAQITYSATIDFHGLAKLAGPLMKLEFERLAGATVTQLTRAVAVL